MKPDWGRWFRMMRPQGDIDEEIRHHLRERTELLVEEGWDPAEATAEADRLFGDGTRIRRQMLAARRMERVVRDPLGWIASVGRAHS